VPSATEPCKGSVDSCSFVISTSDSTTCPSMVTMSCDRDCKWTSTLLHAPMAVAVGSGNCVNNRCGGFERDACKVPLVTVDATEAASEGSEPDLSHMLELVIWESSEVVIQYELALTTTINPDPSVPDSPICTPINAPIGSGRALAFVPSVASMPNDLPLVPDSNSHALSSSMQFSAGM
jgi:hypothetical protein